MTYRGIVIGAGAIGALLEAEQERPKPATHAGALVANEKTELVGLVDADPAILEQASTLFPQIPTFIDVDEALATLRPTIVAIASPAASHLSLVTQSIDVGASMIICEKPIATSLAEAKEIGTLITRSKSTFVLNYQRRFFPLFASVRERIQAGEFGRIQHVTCYYSNGLYNNGGHALDAIAFLLADHFAIVQTSSIAAGVCPAYDINVQAQLRTTRGVTVTLIPLDQTAYGIHELHIFGERGKIMLTEYGYTLTTVPVGPSVFAGVNQLDYVRMSQTIQRESMVAGALVEAIAAHEAGREPVSGLTNGLQVMAALDAIAESAREMGKHVSIPNIV